jgi:hypothetical protein
MSVSVPPAEVTLRASTKPLKPKPKRIKYQWYKPPTFEKESRMTKDEIADMDNKYRVMFGRERGGQKVKNPHAWEMETPTGRMSYLK